MAAALADVLADGDYWQEYEAATEATAPSSLLAQRAVDLYRSLAAFMELSPDVGLDAPVIQAVGAIREIADWGVLASYAREHVGERIPPRSAFEWFIRVGDVDSWARDLGYDLSINQDAHLPDEAWPIGEPEQPEPGAGDLVEAWVLISKRYGWLLEKLDDPDWQRAWESPPTPRATDAVELWREGAAEMIDAVRPWIAWSRRSNEPGAQAVAGVTLWMAECLFAAGWQWPEDGEMLLSPALISEMLRETESLEWLIEHGAELPDWLL